jgi:hypothetical protein
MARPTAPIPPPTPDELASMGITHEVLRRIVVYGERHGRDESVQVDPPGFGGTCAWGLRVRAMAMSLAAHGWRRIDVSGQARIVSPDGRHHIWTVGGNARTGLAGRPYPRAVHDRGPVTQRSTESNARLLFPDFVEDPPPPPIAEAGIHVWVLLANRVVTGPDSPDIARYELSLPSRIINDNFYDFYLREWLGEVVLDDVDDDDGGEDLGDIDIAVTRR